MPNRPERKPDVRLPIDLPIALSELNVDASLPLPIYAQVCASIRASVLNGSLPPASQLPTSRELAGALGISRNTVVNAYAQLVSEGLLEAKFRRGTRVVSNPPFLAANDTPEWTAANSDEEVPEIAFSASHRLEACASDAQERFSFELHAPDPALYPHRALSKLLADEFSKTAERLSSGGEMLRFQTVMANHLRQWRGIKCEPSQIVPVTSSQNAIDVVSRLLIDHGHVVQFDEPFWNGFRSTFLACGARLFPLALSSSADAASVPPPRLILAAPSAGAPFGTLMTDSRRRAISDHARRWNSVILEWDQGADITHSSDRTPTLQACDPVRTIYYGSLAESLGSSLGLGYLVLPKHFVDPLEKLLRQSTKGPEPFILSAVAAFIASGQHRLHVRRIRRLYAARMARLCKLLRAQFGETISVQPGDGLHLSLLLPDNVPAEAVCRAAREQNLAVAPLTHFYQGPEQANGIVLGIGNCPDRQLEAVVQRIARCIAGTTGTIPLIAAQ